MGDAKRFSNAAYQEGRKEVTYQELETLLNLKHLKLKKQISKVVDDIFEKEIDYEEGIYLDTIHYGMGTPYCWTNDIKDAGLTVNKKRVKENRCFYTPTKKEAIRIIEYWYKSNGVTEFLPA